MRNKSGIKVSSRIMDHFHHPTTRPAGGLNLSACGGFSAISRKGKGTSVLFRLNLQSALKFVGPASCNKTKISDRWLRTDLSCLKSHSR